MPKSHFCVNLVLRAIDSCKETAYNAKNHGGDCGPSRIGDYAFADNNLENMIIPESVARIGAFAFSCNRLKRVIVLCPSASFDEHVFADKGGRSYEKLAITGWEGSNVERYAIRYEYRFEPLGRLSAVSG